MKHTPGFLVIAGDALSPGARGVMMIRKFRIKGDRWMTRIRFRSNEPGTWKRQFIFLRLYIGIGRND